MDTPPRDDETKARPELEIRVLDQQETPRDRQSSVLGCRSEPDRLQLEDGRGNRAGDRANAGCLARTAPKTDEGRHHSQLGTERSHQGATAENLRA